MSNTNTLIQQQKKDLEILNGFFIIKEYLKQRGVNFETIEIIHNEVKTAYYKHNSFKFPFKLLQNDILYVDGKKIQLKPSILNAGYSSFNASSIYNQQDGFQLDGLTSTLSNSGDPTLEGIAVGLQLLDGLGLDIETNVNNVLTYGLDSWGAASNPNNEMTEKIQPQLDKLNSLIKSINDSNIIDVLNKAEHMSSYIEQYYQTTLNRRDWAGSTTAAFELHVKKMTEWRSQILNTIIEKIKNGGYPVSSQNQIGTFTAHRTEYLPYVKSDNTTSQKNDNWAASKGKPFTYKVYSIKNKSTTLTNPSKPPSTTKTINTNNLFKVAGIGALAWFVVPKFENSNEIKKKKIKQEQP